MKELLKKEFIFLDDDSNDVDSLFANMAKIAVENGIANNEEDLISSFKDREKEASTGFEDSFAIPHARSKVVLKPCVFYIRTKKLLKWESIDGKGIKNIIMLMIPESNGDYLDILSGIAQNLMGDDFRKSLKKSDDKNEIIELLSKKAEIKESIEFSGDALTVVGVSACATGVAHTYMARDALLEAGKALNWNVYIETQGQKGPEFQLTNSQIEKADAVILATDIAIETDRFAGKKVYKIGTKAVIADPKQELRYSVSKSKILSTQAADAGIFDVKDKKAWIGHIMSGVSFMIPFIVFAGIIFAIVTGIGKASIGAWLDYSGKFDGSAVTYIQEKVHLLPNMSLGSNWELAGLDANGVNIYTVTIHGWGIGILYYLNSFAGIGFTVMIPIMGAYIANSIAGRAALTPAFILTWAGTNPNLWLQWGPFANKEIVDLFPGNGGGIFAALLFGFTIGYTVKWINTKWKINKYIQPIMPIIIIPVFVSLFFGALTIFLIGNCFGYVMGYVNKGLSTMEQNQVGMAGLGLLLGLLAGVDMGGPINKIASFGATALIFTDGGKAMGTAAAAFAVAPMGCGITSLIFRKKFQKDKELGVNAVILGFMGISEGAIPFAAKYTWAAIVPNIIGSGIAAMCAGLFHVSGWVGAWGGPIIALFGGVTTWDMSYIGVLWYLIAIAIGIVVQVILFRILVEVQSKGKLSGSDFKAIFSKTHKTKDFVKEKQRK